MPTPKSKPSIYQLKITLLGIEPPIWRRIQVPSTMLLCCCMTHCRRSWAGPIAICTSLKRTARYWGVPENDEFGDLELIDESKVPVGKVLLAEGDSMVYLYDFGDSWRHEVVLEKIVPVDAAVYQAGLPCR